MRSFFLLRPSFFLNPLYLETIYIFGTIRYIWYINTFLVMIYIFGIIFPFLFHEIYIVEIYLSIDLTFLTMNEVVLEEEDRYYGGNDIRVCLVRM